MAGWDQHPEVRVLQRYLQIPSVHPDVDYSECVSFLETQALELGLPAQVLELVPHKPVVIISWPGTDPTLPSILLNSHMDVVPVNGERWVHPPFSGHIDKEGWIYGRGAQDMKSVGIQHLEAVRRLRRAGVTLKRSVHISFVPDEEIGGVDGMKKFVESKQYAALNVGLALDESMPNPKGSIIGFYAERSRWHVTVVSTAAPGHGATLPPDTAGEKLNRVISKFLERRGQELAILTNTKCSLGDVTTINLTKLYGGVQVNVLPEELSAEFDVRVAPHEDHDQLEAQMRQWCSEAGAGVDMHVTGRNEHGGCSSTDEGNRFYAAIVDAARLTGIDIEWCICPGATDARFVRSAGAQAYGLSPQCLTPQCLHAHDERLQVQTFLRGIQLFENILRAVADLP